MTGVTLDWNAIRPLNGGREKGFEELCAQLARTEVPAGVKFVRKGTPDAGVECYAIFSDGSEWAWQSKYFHPLGDSQWGQIDKSVRAALDKHPALVRYYVCVPLDLPDGRIPGRRSAKDRWDEHVTKWQGWVTNLGRTIEFVFWGSSELLERLRRTEHVGRVGFWFDKRGFDNAWFAARVDEAVLAAGPRYTPEIHVELPIARDLESFGREQRLFDDIKALAVPVRDGLRSVRTEDAVRNDTALSTSLARLSLAVQTLLDALSAVEAVAAGPLPFPSVLQSVTGAIAEAHSFSALLRDRAASHDASSTASPPDARAVGRSNTNPFQDAAYHVRRLDSALTDLSHELKRAERLAGSSLLLLTGDAGTGKTHLLCDVAKGRLAANHPTILLMGQRFLSHESPWTQVLQQLDIPHLSAERFVGALEAAAQASGVRAILMIDAINEGTGRTLWPDHLAAFLAPLARSPWIGIVLSVRSSYEEVVVPKEVRDSAVRLMHHGFDDHEYDATKTFFVHYGLELPSTPLLAPEFSNPLFLKTLCAGLQAQGARRLPRGLHGITAVFDMYLGAINARLAKLLGFDPKKPLVQRALAQIALALVATDERWLPREQAESVVDALLPEREFERSLFRHLIVEGLLNEDVSAPQGTYEDIIYIAYERKADHLVAEAMLAKVPAGSDWEAAFAEGGVLAPLIAKEHIAEGLLEALSIQVPERCGRELLELAPGLSAHWGVGDAFRESLVWRKHSAFSDATRTLLNDLCKTQQDLDDTLDTLLTVALLPGHPLNAKFLDQRLRRDTMAERDAWWSLYLHRAWGSRGAVDRLVDWAWTIERGTVVDEDAVDLCAIALAWILSSSNRFLRDRATKALVSLLTGRVEPMIRLVDRFADVNDPYVVERVLAVAYGVSMRCHESASVGALAACVHRHVFASGSPPPHILLRDYARGVVERAFHLGAATDIAPESVRPPYKTTWPTIPSEEDVKPFLADWSKGSHDSGQTQWSRNRVAMSVMDDDFARYVIGTNSSWHSTEWLARPLGETAFSRSNRPALRAVIAEFSEPERRAWNVFWRARRDYRAAVRGVQSMKKDASTDLRELVDSVVALRRLRKRLSKKLLIQTLTRDHLSRLRGGRFDLRHIQRYVLKRVFDLGWTEERFGHFDRYEVLEDGRSAMKAERIGKKYQWIAYHEILALISDHFQYREQYGGHGDRKYEGPWQDHLRDIDPSCTLSSLPGGTSWEGHAPAWWAPESYRAWPERSKMAEWLARTDDLPKVEELLSCVDPSDGSRWLNVDGYFNWKQDVPAGERGRDIERGEIWHICDAYLIRTKDTGAFLKWAEGVDFWGKWMPEPPKLTRMFLGEHGWSPAARYFQRPYYGDDGWTRPGRGCPVEIRTVGIEYVSETSGFDCSLDESCTLELPDAEVLETLGLRWTGPGAGFVDASGRVVAMDPTEKAPGPSALLLRADSVEQLAAKGLTLCWAVLGEKSVHGRMADDEHHPSLRMTGAFVLQGSKLQGFVKRAVEVRDGGGALTPVDVYRSDAS